MWPRLKRRRCLLEYSIRVGQNFQRLLSVKLIYNRERSKSKKHRDRACRHQGLREGKNARSDRCIPSQNRKKAAPLKALSFKTLNSMRLREIRHSLRNRPAEVSPFPSGGLRNDLVVLRTNEMILPPALF